MKSIAYLPGALKTLEQQMFKSLGQFYDNYTVEEWLEQHIKPLELRIDDLMTKAKSLTEKKVWPRRPLGFEKDSRSKIIEEEVDPLSQMPRK